MIDGKEFSPGYEFEQLDDDRFEVTFPHRFGGLTLAAVTLLAGRSCPDKRLRSSHMWFLRGTPVDTPFQLEIERIRDGRMLSHRRVKLVHEDKLLVEFTASYTSDTEGMGAPSMTMQPGLPQPEDLMHEEELAKKLGWEWWSKEGYEWRLVGTPYKYGTGTSRTWHGWVKPFEPFKAEDAVHASAFAYMSDNHSEYGAGLHNEKFDHDSYVSLDNAIWAHRPIVWHDWLLVSSTCDIGVDGRVFTRRNVFTRDGDLMATIAQEAQYLGPY